MSVSRFDSLERDKIVKMSQEFLWGSDGQPGREYILEQRRIKEKTAKRFNLGYVPPKTKHQLADRIIFPIYDPSDNLIAISSRAINGSASSLPKYWHEQYNKSFYLYGMNLAKNKIRETKFSCVTEGNFDVVKAHDEGLTNVVGLMGTTISDYQMAVLMRYCEEIIFCFDNDENKAGEKAGNKVVSKLKNYESSTGLETLNIVSFSIMKLTGAKDPDEFIRKFGIIPFKKLVKQELDKIRSK